MKVNLYGLTIVIAHRHHSLSIGFSRGLVPMLQLMLGSLMLFWSGAQPLLVATGTMTPTENYALLPGFRLGIIKSSIDFGGENHFAVGEINELSVSDRGDEPQS